MTAIYYVTDEETPAGFEKVLGRYGGVDMAVAEWSEWSDVLISADEQDEIATRVAGGARISARGYAVFRVEAS